MIKCSACGQKIKWIQIAGENGSSKLGTRSFKMQGLEPVDIEGWVDVALLEDKMAPKPGIFCKLCFAPIDSEETAILMQHSRLSDTPLIYTPPENVNLDKIVSSIKKTYGKAVLTIVDSEKERPAQRVSVEKLSFLSPAVRGAIERKLPPDSGIYHHQREAIEALVDGKNVILATDTSSGKSLCFQTAILENAARANKNGGDIPTTLYLGPLNALIDDQFKSLSEFADKVSPGEAWQSVNYGFFKRIKLDDGTKLGLAQYHGNVSVENGQRNGLTSELRRSIRKEQPEVLFSNPEMLGRAILPLAIDKTPPGIGKPKRGAGQWEYFFKRLS